MDPLAFFALFLGGAVIGVLPLWISVPLVVAAILAVHGVIP